MKTNIQKEEAMAMIQCFNLFGKQSLVGFGEGGSLLEWQRKAQYEPLKGAEMEIALSLGGYISNLRKDLHATNYLLDKLSDRPIISNTTLYDLGSTNHSLKIPINIVLEKYEDEIIAKFPELEAFGSGDTEAEAIMNLKIEILALYSDLRAKRKTKLGLLPKMWLRILTRLIKS